MSNSIGQRMRYAIFAFTLVAGAAVANDEARLGDGQIDGSELQPYELSWRQCSLQEDEWVAMNDLTERLVVIGEDVLRIQQTSKRPDGGQVVSTSYLDRRSMAPLRLEQHATGADGGVQGNSEHTLTDSGYTGLVVRGAESKRVEGKVNSTMLHGNVMGLPLATVGNRAEPLDFAASMISFDATYKVTATWMGTDTLDFNGAKIEAEMVDVHWVHQEIGDVYPGGPDASGGRYWVVQNPPDGFPYVPRYKTDTYAVEFVKGACP